MQIPGILRTAAPGAHFGDIWSVSDHGHKMGAVAGRQEEHGALFEILELVILCSTRKDDN